MKIGRVIFGSIDLLVWNHATFVKWRSFTFVLNSSFSSISSSKSPSRCFIKNILGFARFGV